MINFGKIQQFLCLWEIMALTPSNNYAHLAAKQQLLTKISLEYHANNIVFLKLQNIWHQNILVETCAIPGICV